MGLMGLRDIRIGVSIPVHNEKDYINYCLRSIYDFAHVIVLSVNVGVPWGGTPEPLDETMEVLRAFPDPDGKLRILTDEWGTEIEQRTAGFDLLKREANYLMNVDADEVYSKAELDRLKKFVALRPFVGQFRITMKTYWKTHPFHVIDPPEPYRRHLLSRIRPSTKLIHIHRTNERWRVTVPRSVAVCHHFSYGRSDERIRQKLANTLHRDELVPNWYENVWLGWDANRNMEDLHPTHPPEYKRAIAVELDSLPDVMRDHPFAR